MLTRNFLGFLVLVLGLLPQAAANEKSEYFAIKVVDAQTGRGVPLVQLTTTNDVVYYTDSNGLVAIQEPGLNGQSVFFSVKSDGYEFAKDGFGIHGKALQVQPGTTATLKIKRLNIAERLYRITGGDIYRDTILLGGKAPTAAPLLNGQVFGSDSIENAVYRSKIYWFWGDTNKPSYPLGLFDVPGATSLLPSAGGLDPSKGVDLQYFVGDKGFVRAMAKMPGEGPTWIDGLFVIRVGNREHMFSPYMKIKPPLTTYRRGLVEFDDAAQVFRQVADFPLDAPLIPSGHPFHYTSGGSDYVYFSKSFPLVRVPSSLEAVKDLSQYEAFTCLKAGSKLEDKQLDRAPDGTLNYSWKKSTPVVGQAEQKKLVDAGVMKASEGLLQLRDHDTAKTVIAHHGSVYWNEFRKRWVAIISEAGGTSYLGETWFAEADTPTGPWVYAVKIVTHDRYSFYNPKQDPMFDQDGGRTIYFEGTYTNSFSGNSYKTPRYDYNQIMYRLDLADSRLVLPAPLYREAKPGEPARLEWRRPGAERTNLHDLAFFALDRPRPGTVPIQQSRGQNAYRLQTGTDKNSNDPKDGATLFYALPPDAANPPASTVALFQWTTEDGKDFRYVTDDSNPPKGLVRAAKPLCRVWKNPYRGK